MSFILTIFIYRDNPILIMLWFIFITFWYDKVSIKIKKSITFQNVISHIGQFYSHITISFSFINVHFVWFCCSLPHIIGTVSWEIGIHVAKSYLQTGLGIKEYFYVYIVKPGLCWQRTDLLRTRKPKEQRMHYGCCYCCN